jgi:hypothetical protein
VTSGVKLMKLNESDVVVSIAKVRETVSKNAEDEYTQLPEGEDDSDSISEEAEEDPDDGDE